MYQIAVNGRRIGIPLSWDEAKAVAERLKYTILGLEIKPFKGAAS